MYMKTNYLVTAQCEVLVEYANAVMAKYEKYLRSKSALDCVKRCIKTYAHTTQRLFFAIISLI